MAARRRLRGAALPLALLAGAAGPLFVGPVLRRAATGGAVALEAAAPAGEVLDAVVLETNSTADDPLPPPLSEAAELRASLLRRLDGLEQGRAASREDADEVARLATELADAATAAGRWKLELPGDLDILEGRWKLLYTSAFVGPGSSLGGLRPGPPLQNPVADVGDIVQRYRVNASRADTIVQLRPPVWLREAGILGQLPFVGENPETIITLTQQFDVAGSDTLRFAFVEGEVDSRAMELLRPVKFPMTLFGFPPETSRDTPVTDTLVTTYCDGELRIGKGGRFGELRVFLRD